MHLFLRKVLDVILDTLNIMTGEVLIGLSPTIGKDNRHGVVHLKCKHGGIVHTSFKADKPNKLVKPSLLAMRSLFIQVTKMGYVAEFIEIMVGDETVVYQKGFLLPVYKCKKTV